MSNREIIHLSEVAKMLGIDQRDSATVGDCGKTSRFSLPRQR
jgi:hypothetical protein